MDLSSLTLPIETARLVVRPWSEDDVESLTASVSRSLHHLRPWMSWAAREPLTTADRIEFLRASREAVAAGTELVLGMFAVGDGAVVGGCGLHPRVGADGLEIGYWVDVEHLRRGFASEVSAALTDAAFTRSGVARVEIHHDRANIASAGVPRRLGFRFVEERQDEVLAPGECGLEWVWRMERADWAGGGAEGTAPAG